MSATVGTGVPLCDLHEQYRELQPQLEAAVARVLASGQVILGPEVAALEEEVAHYCGAAFAVGCGSGTDALLLALHALGIGPGDEVILPPFTFFATAGAVCRSGARPVFADIDPLTYNLDPLQVENKITPRTRAILPVHLYGQCADMEPFWQVAERHNLALIEDAAQALGAEYQGKRTGTLGAVGCFSFYPTKNLGAYGDAGMVVTNDPDWCRRMTCLRVHGMEPKYYHKYLGWNARLDALQAAMLRVKLPHLDRWTAARQTAARRYDVLIEEYHLTRFLERPVIQPRRRHVFNQYVVRVAQGQRDALVRHLKNEKIGCEIYYPVPLHLQECLAHLGYAEGDFPASEEASRSVLALPMYPELAEQQQRRVVQTCAAFVRSAIAWPRERKASTVQSVAVRGTGAAPALPPAERGPIVCRSARPTMDCQSFALRRPRLTSLVIFLGCLLIYHLNGRPHAGFDTFAAPYTAWSLVRHCSLDLRPYEELRLCLGTHVKELPDGRWISIRGPGSALVAVPVVAPLALFRERPPSATTMHHLGKLASAICVAAAGVLFFWTCQRLAPTAAWPATVLFALGTGLASVASQALWMHGPAAFWLCGALYLLLPARDELTPLRAAGAGLALGLATLTRPTTAVFALASGIAMLGQRRWRAAWGLLLGGLVPAACQCLLNFGLFDHPFVGGYEQENWTMPTPLAWGLAGLLIAPSRGLLVYSPALLLLPLGVWALWRNAAIHAIDHARGLLLAWLAAAGVTLLFYAMWYDWSGGWCFGPRFLCEIMPICCTVFALGYAALRSRWSRRFAGVLIALSVGVQVVGMMGHSAETDWCLRHDMSDQGRSMFCWRDTQIEAYARAMLYAAEKHFARRAAEH